MTIKVTKTCTYDADDATCEWDAIAQAFRDAYYWSCEHHDEYNVTAELQELEVDE